MHVTANKKHTPVGRKWNGGGVFYEKVERGVFWATFLYLVLHVDGHLDEPRQHRLFRADEPPRLGSRHLLQLRGTVVPLAHVAVHLVVGQRRRRLGVLSRHSDDDRPVVGSAL